MGLVLYGSPLSPFYRKAAAVLREKQLAFEEVAVNILPMPEWFKEISPARRIPVLRDSAIAEEGPAGTIPDSSAICVYLERKQPSPSIYPEDAYAHARAIWLEEFCDSELVAVIGMGIFRPIQFARFQGKEPDVETAKRTYEKKLPRLLDHLEGELDGREHFFGSALSIADFACMSSLVQLELVAGPLDAARWPALAAFSARLASHPSFAPCLAVCRKIVKQDPIDLTSQEPDPGPAR